MPHHTPAELIGFIPTTDLDRAIGFYEEILELEYVTRDEYAAVFGSSGQSIRVVEVGSLVPQPFTILGWGVLDIRSTVQHLAGRGLSFLRYAHFEQDDVGIWTAPGGARVVWFHDLDGNVLSYTEFP